MKTIILPITAGRLLRYVSWISVLLLWLQTAAGADFAVTSPGFFFSFTSNSVPISGQNPTITLVRGRTYTFALNTTPNFHPFLIATALGSATAPPGVTGNNGSSSGTITYSVPTNAVDCVYYCTIHFFQGQIHMIDAATPLLPPAVNIIGLTVGTNLTVTTAQTTTNGFSFIPQANTNLAMTNWFALTVLSNRFSNGTNEIFCGRPPGTNVFLRIRIQ
jgi:hypothetical protein